MDFIDYTLIKKPTKFIICSCSGSGKTYLCGHILKKMKFDYVLIISSTSYGGDDYFQKMKLNCSKRIINDPKIGCDCISALSKIQIKRKKENKKMYNIAIVLDDFIEVFKKNDKILQSLFTKGRHYGFSTFLLSQRYKSINSACRANTDYLIYKSVNSLDLEQIYEDYVSAGGDPYSIFKQFTIEFTKEYNFLCLLNSYKQNDSEKFFITNSQH